MSKLFNLKQWLTVADAAKHLSILFGEDVSGADVFRLALDRRLRLSVHFVNHTYARPGKLIPIEEAEYCEVPSLDFERTVRLYKGPVGYTDGIESHVCELEDDIAKLAGVYDLAMIGGEVLEVESRYQLLTGGPPVTLMNLDGCFVEGRNGQLCQLQTSIEDNGYQPGSRAHLEVLKQRIAEKKPDKEKIDDIFKMYEEDRKKFLEAKKSNLPHENYFPAGGLPEDAVFVIRTDALRKFEESIKDAPAAEEKPTDGGEEAEMNTMRGLAVMAWLLSENKSAFKIGDRPNASAIGKEVEELAKKAFGDDVRGFTAFHKKISNALKLFDAKPPAL